MWEITEKVPSNKMNKRGHLASEQSGLVLAISLITGCECILWLSSSASKNNKNPEFCISLAVACQVLLFRCSEQFLTVSRSNQKRAVFCPPVGCIFKRETRYKCTNNSVDMHILLAHCNRIQKKQWWSL